LAQGMRITLNIGMVNAIKKQLQKSNCDRCGEDLAMHTWIDITKHTKEITRCSIVDRK
jgi:ArsR family metal-binding transcriptional regulator